jgi:nucleoside-diphosphate-sugar epimerase
MRVVVTGAAGLVGKATVAECLAAGHDVLALDCVPLDLAGAALDGASGAQVDLLDAQALAAPLRAADAIIHLARMRFPYTAQGLNPDGRTWHKPDPLGDAARLAANVQMTANVLSAAASAGVNRLALGSSLAAYGLYYPSRALAPRYAPIDEGHPLAPDDPYGLSKQLGEQLAQGFAARGGVQVASLRLPGVAGPDHAAFRRAQDPARRGHGALGTWIDARDAARACRLAIETRFNGHEAFNLCASESLLDKATAAVLARVFPECSDIRGDTTGRWPGYDPGRAARRLGFTPQWILGT